MLLGPALVAAGESGDFALLAPAVLFSLIAAMAGLLVGTVCGLSAGITLIVLRCMPGVSRAAVRLTAATGAALLPAAWLTAIPVAGSGWWLAAGALTVTMFSLGAVGGPAVFYDESRKRPRS